MSDAISQRQRALDKLRDHDGQLPQRRPPPPTRCDTTDPFINLCSIPQTEEARQAWQDLLETIKVDLNDEAKLLWWSVGQLQIPGGRLHYREVEYSDFGIPPETIVEEGHYRPWACVQAILHTLEKAIEYKWNTLDDSPDLDPEDLELIQGTIARLFVFGEHWRKGLNQEPHGKAKHNAWRDACYGTIHPLEARMRVVPGALVLLEEMEPDIDPLPGILVAITPADLETAISKLPQDWMIWEAYVLISSHIQDNLFDHLRPFADKLHYPWAPPPPSAEP